MGAEPAPRAADPALAKRPNGAVLWASPRPVNSACRLPGPKLPVPGIAKTRNDVAHIIQMMVDRRQINGHVRMVFLHVLDALRRSDHADELNALDTPALEHIGCGNG